MPCEKLLYVVLDGMNGVRIIQFSSTSQHRAKKKNMIFANELDYKTRKNVVAAYPSAAKVVKVCGGWAVFAFMSDYEMWKAQA